MPTAIAIRHVCFEDWGSFAAVLSARLGPPLEPQSARRLSEWLDGVGL